MTAMQFPIHVCTAISNQTCHLIYQIQHGSHLKYQIQDGYHMKYQIQLKYQIQNGCHLIFQTYMAAMLNTKFNMAAIWNIKSSWLPLSPHVLPNCTDIYHRAYIIKIRNWIKLYSNTVLPFPPHNTHANYIKMTGLQSIKTYFMFLCFFQNKPGQIALFCTSPFNVCLIS